MSQTSNHVVTKKDSLVIPEVMAAGIEAKLIDLIKLAPLAEVNTDLVGNAGDTITLPSYGYIGDAEDIDEGEAVEAAELTATSTPVTVKKAVKAVEITDEALLSAYGDPMSEIENQLAVAIASKVEADCYAALSTIGATMTMDFSTGNTDGNAASTLNKEILSLAVLTKFGEDADGEMFAFVAPAQLHALRTDPDFVHVANGEVVITGQVGQIYGINIVVTNRIKADENGVYTNYIIKRGALGIALKKEVSVETDRDILKKTTVISADRHYTAYLRDASKAIKLKVDAVAAPETPVE